jgi:hypothetical protein
MVSKPVRRFERDFLRYAKLTTRMRQTFVQSALFGGKTCGLLEKTGGAEVGEIIPTVAGVEERAAASLYLSSRGKAALPGTSQRLEHLLY